MEEFINYIKEDSKSCIDFLNVLRYIFSYRGEKDYWMFSVLVNFLDLEIENIWENLVLELYF